MPCQVAHTTSFKRQAEKLNPEIQKRLNRKIKELSEEPAIGRRLKGPLKKLWKIRVGKYRLIYSFKPCRVTLILIGHRETVYFQS